MYDCHHSCDGAFNIVIDNITCNTNSNFNEGTATNFIEIQGENVIVTNVTGNGNDITKQGILLLIMDLLKRMVWGIILLMFL